MFAADVKREFAKEAWTAQLEKLWQAGHQRRTKPLVRALVSFFETTPNCFECALALTCNASDFGKNRPCAQSFAIMCIFKEWLLQHPDRYSTLTSELKARALDTVFTRGSSALVDVVCQAYRLEENACSHVGFVRNLLQKQLFNEACNLVVRLHLQPQFELLEIAVPLYLLNKLSLLDNYLADYPELQKEMVRYLDCLYKDSRPVWSLVQSLNLKDNGNVKLNPRTLGRAISRMLKQYDLPADTCRNFQSSRSKSAMKYLIHKRYDELEYSGPSWREMVLQVVQENEDLHVELVQELMRVNEYESALGFALRLNLPEEKWPSYLHHFRHSYYPPDLTEDMLPAWQADDVSKDTSLFLQLELDLSVVHMVDTAGGFFSCVSVLKTYNVIGMDAEWQPTMGLGPVRLSMLQLAARDCVYILDMLALSETLTEKDWDLLYTEVLAARHIKKLGYGIAEDVKLVVETARSPHASFDNVVDLSKLAHKLQRDYPTLLKPVNQQAMPSKGLSELTRLVLGRPLNKDEQCSDWENRPLREAQLKYAALDAFCLLQIYDELHRAAREEKVDLEELFEVVRPATESGGETKQCKANEDCARPGRPVPATEFRVVVDTMVQGLGRYLRLCGIDTVVLGGDEHHDQAVKIAQKEDRVVITSGAPYEKSKQYLAPGRCFNMDTSLPAQEQLKEVLRFYRVVVNEENLLTRCVACNVPHYALVAHADLRRLSELQAIPDHRALGSTAKETLTRSYGTSCSLDLRSGRFSNGTRVQCSRLSFERLKHVETFYVCTSCGKVYWEGSHHSRLKEQMRLANLLSSGAPLEDVPGASAN